MTRFAGIVLLCAALAYGNTARTEEENHKSSDPSLAAAKKAYEQEEAKINDLLAVANKKADADKEKAKEKLRKAYDAAIRKATQKGDLAAANSLLAEKEALEGAQANEDTDDANDAEAFVRKVKWQPLKGKISEILQIGPFPDGPVNSDKLFAWLKTNEPNFDGKPLARTKLAQGKATNCPAGVLMYFAVFVKTSAKASSATLKVLPTYNGTVSAYLDSQLTVLSGDVSLDKGVHIFLFAAKTGMGGDFTCELSGEKLKQGF